MESISQKFAGFARGLTFSDISRDHIHKIKTYFLDWLGSALAGKDEPPVKIMLEVGSCWRWRMNWAGGPSAP
ncbi:MAG: MmgE/PrpD family protein [Deltaproteobacteria bacterium]|nr:MmgE/PrpD family protein [Deltaproteobacteria bacterium]